MFGGKTRADSATAAIRLPKPIAPSRERFPDNATLLQFAPGTAWDLKSAYEGTQIFGGVGSGKTSSTGQMIAKSFLRRNMGGLVLCCKPDEKDLWLRYAKETGRSESVIVFDGSGKERLNFLDYAAQRSEFFDARNVVTLFSTIMEAAGGGRKEGGDQRMWQGLSEELLTSAVAVLYSAWGRVTLAQMMELIDSAPQTEKQAGEPEWRDRSFCFRTLFKMQMDPAVPLPQHDRDHHGTFFMKRWARRHDKIRTSIESTFSSSAYPFQSGTLHTLFCTHTTTVPEQIAEGAIVITDLSVQTHGAAGIVAQHIWKYLFQKAILERKNTRSDQVRPVFLWADECQFFINTYDREFLGIARQAKVCTVFITQNLPTYFAAMSCSDPVNTVKALLGNMQTKIFHQNQDADTNKLASTIVGQDFMEMESVGVNTGTSTNEGSNNSRNEGVNSGWTSSGQGGSSNSGGSRGSSAGTSSGTGTSQGTSRTVSKQLHDELMPNVFPTLRKGGGREHPEIILLQGGRRFPSNCNATWLRCQVPQG